MNKILIIGCGGIGSFLVREIHECVMQEQIDAFTQIDIADDDMVEINQLRYQNFEEKDIGKNKAEALAKRYHSVHSRDCRINKLVQLKGYDLIIICADNELTRSMVIHYCHDTDKEFIDLCATGRKIFALPKQRTLQDSIKFVDIEDRKEYSCQDKMDLERGLIQKGNKIVAVIGCQMLLNLLRGHNNRPICLVI